MTPKYKFLYYIIIECFGLNNIVVSNLFSHWNLLISLNHKELPYSMYSSKNMKKKRFPEKGIFY